MASLALIREGMTANLDAVFSRRGWQVSPYRLANPTPPTMQVMGPDGILYDEAMQRGHDEWTLIVQAFVALQSDIGAQALLDALLDSAGDLSVKAAIETDVTLGGACETLRVTESTGYRLFQIGDRVLFGADWTVVVDASGGE